MTKQEASTRAQKTTDGASDWDNIFISAVQERLERHKCYFPPEGFTADLYQAHFWLLVEKYEKNKTPSIMADLHELRDGKTFTPDDELFLRVAPSFSEKHAYSIYVMDFDGSETKLVDIKTDKGLIQFARTKNARLVPIMEAIGAEFGDYYSGEILAAATSIEKKKRGRAATTSTRSKRAAKRRRYDEAEEVNEDDDGEDSEEEEEDEFDDCQVVNNNVEVNGDGQM